MELAFRRWGQPKSPEELEKKKPKIVFLHGLGGTGSLWRPIGASLEEDFDLLAPDQRGHGASRISGLSGYAPTDYAQDVVQTLESLKFYPTTLIGHSMGARTACAAASIKPDWIRSLVLVDIGFDGLAGGGLGDALARFIRILPERFPDRAAARSFMADHCPDSSMGQYLMAVSTPLSSDQGGGFGFPFDHSALIRTVEQAQTSSIRSWVELAASNQIPTLALRGSLSQVWSKQDYLAEIRHFSDPIYKNQVSFLEIEGAGHGLPFEKRPEFIQAIRSFIPRE